MGSDIVVILPAILQLLCIHAYFTSVVGVCVYTPGSVCNGMCVYTLWDEVYMTASGKNPVKCVLISHHFQLGIRAGSVPCDHARETGRSTKRTFKPVSARITAFIRLAQGVVGTI